jgi:hypothetical protein
MAYLPAIHGAAFLLGMSFVPETVNATAGTVGRSAVGAQRKPPSLANRLPLAATEQSFALMQSDGKVCPNAHLSVSAVSGEASSPLL